MYVSWITHLYIYVCMYRGSLMIILYMVFIVVIRFFDSRYQVSLTWDTNPQSTDHGPFFNILTFLDYVLFYCRKYKLTFVFSAKKLRALSG